MSFNHNIRAYNTKAAEIIVPFIMKEFNPSSVIDIGCGIGTWLSVFKKYGITDFLGVDGDYVDRKLLTKYVGESDFYPFDLKNELNLNRNFDLVISLEVAEHIEPKFANNFVKTLINHSEIIVFSAAIPYQIGENHVNEQWPSYWIEKFEKHGYFAHDILRPMIWKNQNIEYWYRQNIIIFKKGVKPNTLIMDMVHPSLYSTRIKELIKEIEDLQSGKLGLRFYIKICFSIIKMKIYGNNK